MSIASVKATRNRTKKKEWSDT